MKPTRVILTANENPNYYHFWNPLSKVYKEKFGITPTLIWFGNKKDIKRLGLSKEYGDIVVQKPVKDYPIPVQTTWALYYFTKLYPDDIITICGIDEVPLSKMFLFDMVQDVSDDAYVMLIGDAYRPHYWANEGGVSPSGGHMAKGSTFQKAYEFEDTFEEEFEKVYNNKVPAFWESTAGQWGKDESYMSLKIREYVSNGGKVIDFQKYALLCERRIECERHKETPYDINRLNAGWYSQSHLCRPFTNHVDYITKLFNDIPKWI